MNRMAAVGTVSWRYVAPKLSRAWSYARVEMGPPRFSDLPQIRKGFTDIADGFKTKKWQQFSVKAAWLNFLVAVEVVCWFFVGEIIGKRRIIGYQIPFHVGL